MNNMGGTPIDGHEACRHIKHSNNRVCLHKSRVLPHLLHQGHNGSIVTLEFMPYFRKWLAGLMRRQFPFDYECIIAVFKNLEQPFKSLVC